MAEAIISRRGSGQSRHTQIVYELYTTNGNWTVPNNAINNTFSVIVYGGGGGREYVDYSNGVSGVGSGMSVKSLNGRGCGGGGGGWMNNRDLVLTPGQSIAISIGRGGSGFSMESGGTTSFGSYLSAAGGECGTVAGGGGNGGSGGGGGPCTRGGIGYQFGGGGSGGIIYFNSNDRVRNTINGNGGNGGPWGGGGGGGLRLFTQRSTTYGRYGVGGTYGGNGGMRWQEDSSIYNVTNITTPAENGTNTLNINLLFNGNGIAQKTDWGIESNLYEQRPIGGGGGYGGMGGLGSDGASFLWVYGYNNYLGYSVGGGGGGGYGGNGGNGGTGTGGGGGGYGGDGKAGDDADIQGIGIRCGGGGGGFGRWGYGAGAPTVTSPAAISGMPGVCFISWISYVDEINHPQVGL